MSRPLHPFVAAIISVAATILLMPAIVIIGTLVKHPAAVTLLGLPLTFALAWIWARSGQPTRRPGVYDYPTQAVPGRGGSRPVDPGQQVYGVAGGAIGSSASTFGAANTSAGVEGERQTGVMLDRLVASDPNIYVFHGLRWPGSANADIDHVVYARSTSGVDVIICLDSKRWASGDYAWDGTMAYLNGQPKHEIKFANGDIERAMKRAFPAATIAGAIIMHGAHSVTNRGHVGVPMLKPSELVPWLRSITGTTANPNLTILDELRSRLKA